ncbi:MAG: hypothetical protein IJT14_03495, partial [Rickettsiales bacterium]|nr:hypothetical protein [Rickettsiales bacterium]
MENESNIIAKELRICWHFKDDSKNHLTNWEDNYDCIRKIIHILYPDAQLIPIGHIDNCDTQIWQIVIKEVGKTLRNKNVQNTIKVLGSLAIGGWIVSSSNIQVNINSNNNLNGDTYTSISKDDFLNNKIEEQILNGSAKDLKKILLEEQYIQIQQHKNKFSKLA